MPLGRSNLVSRALRLVRRRAAVHIHKALPHGGGLGGGSADAAAVLRWAGFDDPARAVELGSDVPFCLVGGRAARARRRSSSSNRCRSKRSTSPW